MIPQTVLTEDGSITCLDIDSGELYHNKAGAFTEALQHYVVPADLARYIHKQSNISILDVCFGLGYNSFVFLDKLIEHTEQAAIGHNKLICHILGIESAEEILQLMPQVLQNSQFENLHRYRILEHAKQMLDHWQKSKKYEFEIKSRIPISVIFDMKLTDLRQVLPELASHKFDYIFHDGFSPRSMPELWTVDLFRYYTKMIGKSGRIVTYSSASAIRGAFKECGLEVRKTAPLGGKSGGTVAYCSEQGELANEGLILLLNEEENNRLNSRSAVPYRDHGLNNLRVEIIKSRTAEIASSKLPVYRRFRLD